MKLLEEPGGAGVPCIEPEAFIRNCRPEFRAISTPFGRVGVRLEAVFWKALEGVSQRESRSLSALVSEIVTEAKKSDINATSALRCYAMNRHMQDAGLLTLVDTPLKRSRLLQSGPFPSVSVMHGGRIAGVSPEFVRYLGAETNSAFSENDRLRVRFDIPFDAVLENVSSHGFLECGLHIANGAVERRTIARVIGVPPKPFDSVVAYVLQ